jgi:hypothetical protein
MIQLLPLNASASGVTPTFASDSAPTPQDMTITFGAGSWTANAAGNGLTFVGATGAGAVATGLGSGNKIYDAINGAISFTVELVFTTPAGTPNNFAPVFAIVDEATGDSIIALLWANTNSAYRLYYGDDTVRRRHPLALGTTFIAHLVYDSAQATDNERVKLYLSGVDDSTVVSNPTQNAPFQTTMPTTISEGLCNFGDLGLQYTGSIYYAALYTGAFSAAEALQRSAALAANNDLDPTPVTYLRTGGAEHYRRRMI